MPHLWLALSAHGYGHAAQAGPIVAALRRRVPGLEVTVAGALPRGVLASRFVAAPFHHRPEATDVGMAMTDALAVDVAASRAAYATWHRDWPRRLDAATAALAAARPDLLLADVPYLPLAAARRAGVPAVAVCSLNWADIYRALCLDDGAPDAAWETMHDAYAGAERFYRPAPSMPMSDLGNTVAVGPIAGRGRARRDELRRALGSDARTRLVLVALGGMPGRLPVEHWPERDDIRYLLPAAWKVARADTHALEVAGLPFLDLLASCDALLAKPGYGLFAEAACHGVPVAVVPRGPWPESDCLVAWLQRHARAVTLDAGQLAQGAGVVKALESLWARAAPPCPEADGAETIAGELAGRWLSG